MTSVEMDLNKAMQYMLNGLDIARRSGKYTFEEGYFITQALYGFRALNENKKKVTDTTNEKKMEITWPDNFTGNDYVQVILRHLELAQSRGAFSFAESAILSQAIDFLKNNKQESNNDNKEATSSTNNTDLSSNTNIDVEKVVI